MFGMDKSSFDIPTSKLKKAKPENLIRLALFLGLDITGMKHRQIARLVRWRITRPQVRFANLQKRQEYAAMWENL
jgi:hypothetical protein